MTHAVSDNPAACAAARQRSSCARKQRRPRRASGEGLFRKRIVFTQETNEVRSGCQTHRRSFLNRVPPRGLRLDEDVDHPPRRAFGFTRSFLAGQAHGAVVAVGDAAELPGKLREFHP